MLKILLWFSSVFLVQIWCAFNSNLPSNVITLDSNNFENLVIDNDEIWMVRFCLSDSQSCKNSVNEYENVAATFKGIVKMGHVNADLEPNLSRKYRIETFPTHAIFSLNKKTPELYKDSVKAYDLVQVIQKAINTKIKQQAYKSIPHYGEDSNEKDVIELTDANFDKKVLNSEDMWMVEFFAPWCGHCKQLAPNWASAAKTLKGRVKFGALDATIHQSKAREYGINGYPTIKVFPPGSSDKNAAVDFDGGRSAEQIVAWAEGYWRNIQPPPEVVQLLDLDSFYGEQGDNTQLYVLLFVPHILDCNAKCRIEHIELMQKFGNQYKDKQWRWLWSEGGAQTELENAMNVGGAGYPTVVVISMKKKSYVVFHGAYNNDSLGAFLRNIAHNKAKIREIHTKDFPHVSSISAWDGKDGELPVEESFDEKDEL